MDVGATDGSNDFPWEGRVADLKGAKRAEGANSCRLHQLQHEQHAVGCPS